MKVKVSSLKHHPKNKETYTLSSIEELMESVSEVGLLQSLIIDQHHQIISGNRRFESIKRLGWNEVEVEVKEVKEGEEELLLIYYNKQRIKSFKELINEHLTLDNLYRKGQGKRTDLTSVKSNRSSILKENTPAPFPNEIITLPILQTSKEFELVLDPFMGSGTTGRVCDKLGRRFVGYDLKNFF